MNRPTYEIWSREKGTNHPWQVHHARIGTKRELERWWRGYTGSTRLEFQRVKVTREVCGE
jgi:hypothetical protein